MEKVLRWGPMAEGLSRVLDASGDCLKSIVSLPCEQREQPLEARFREGGV